LSNNISDKDRKDWKKFISSKDKLPNKDLNSFKEKNFIKKSIDLHGYTLDQANIEIERFIIDSHLKGVDKITIVTGKGLHSQNDKNPYVSKDFAILKYSVPEFITNNQNLMKLIIRIEDAKVEDGGSGAIYVFLKKND
tara:strand:+ start:637 stop:1050 length:414 start_codon:yes stop_codon:yes gene_type:complete